MTIVLETSIIDSRSDLCTFINGVASTDVVRARSKHTIVISVSLSLSHWLRSGGPIAQCELIDNDHLRSRTSPTDPGRAQPGFAQALPITAVGQRAFSISSVVSWNCS